MTFRTLGSLLLVLALLATACSGSTEQATDASLESPDSEFLSSPPSSLPLIDEETTTTTEAEVVETTTTTTIEEAPETTAPETTVVEEATCGAPIGAQRYIDVAILDPDGGLNVRSAPGSSNAIVETLPRASVVVTSGSCETVSTIEWFEISSVDGPLTGWVSSNFLSEEVVYLPGIGNPVDNPENVGISAPTLDEIAAIIATSLGFDGNVVITQLEEPVANDAIGGDVSYELTGLQDDATNGFVVDISFQFDRQVPEGEFLEGELENEVVGFTTLRVTNSPLCIRGVTDDGLCR